MKDLTGERFGRLLVVRQVSRGGARRIKYLCRCDCGKEKACDAFNLIYGDSKSCGCLKIDLSRKAKTTHGHSYSKTYHVWDAMIQRCRPDSKNPKYKTYSRIKVCARWMSFENFLEDMGECPPGMSLERQEVTGDYTKENCIWIPRDKQNANTTRTVWVIVDGKRVCCSEAARLLGINRNTLRHRVRKNTAHLLSERVTPSLNVQQGHQETTHKTNNDS